MIHTLLVRRDLFKLRHRTVGGLVDSDRVIMTVYT